MDMFGGKVAVVTGAGTGIGAGIARSLAGRGVAVAACGRRHEPLASVVKGIVAAGGRATAVQADVSVEADAHRIVETAIEAYGGLDFLINNAGVGGGGPIHRHSVETWDRVMSINLRGPFLMARFSLPHMREHGRGHIVNISSESGLEYYRESGAYGVSKHALNALGEYIQRENQDHGIRVDTICPGMVVTEMTQESPGLDHDKCLVPNDIAELVVWLLGRRPNIKIGTPILIQTMENPWE
jgi:NAD(P)-dependent dehydrogenase (short-subunit alcohol dehydrogenase family)